MGEKFSKPLAANQFEASTRLMHARAAEFLWTPRSLATVRVHKMLSFLYCLIAAACCSPPATTFSHQSNLSRSLATLHLLFAPVRRSASAEKRSWPANSRSHKSDRLLLLRRPRCQQLVCARRASKSRKASQF